MTLLRSLLVSLLLLVWGAGPVFAQDRAEEAFRKGSEALDELDYTTALAHFDQALALDANHADAYAKRGQLYWMLLQHERAVPDLTRALELDPDRPWAYYFRGVSQMHLRHFDAGLADLTQAVASEALPSEFHVRALHFRGIGYMNLGRYDEAITDISKCIDLEPKQPLYLYERATLHEAVGNPQAAAVDYETYLAFDLPENDRTTAIRDRLAALRKSDR